jgi:hypothetical protein
MSFHFCFLIWHIHVCGMCPKDCRCYDGRFPVSGSCVTMPYPDSRSSGETGVDPGIKIS